MDDLLPDAGEAFRLWAGTVTTITDIVGTRISVRLAGDQPAIRYAVVGGRTAPGEADPLLQIDCWGRGNAPDDGTAGRLARTVLAAAPDFRGPCADGWIAGAAAEGYPIWRPDPTTDRPRYLVTLRVVTAS